MGFERFGRIARRKVAGRSAGLLAVSFGALVALSAPSMAQSIATPVGASVTLPGGASSLTETHEDWTVSCQVQNNEKRCLFSQTLGNQQTGQRVLSIELRPQDNGEVQGVILAPFGLRLSDGVTLKVDDKAIGDPVPFSTCMEAGCLVPVTLDSSTLGTVSGGEKMTVNALNSANGQPVELTLSLKGFTAAMNRAKELMQ
ncbi:invasion associated locus B family protein [Methyloligella sp. 2.7D]|uniref:invasion associated locus B family protein n=1 Tax=unclassified Methyloligella TaxID=2625955 RepID=UPI00157BE343|nr:invasion associated locus B family protein [Methyloligella sp. GL2]QKP77346.1 invasion associated locus B family protein [Methyloligella sp. GL2]